MRAIPSPATRPNGSKILLAIAVALPAALWLPAPPAAAQTTIVARSGVAAPAGGNYGNSLGTTPVINDAGQVAFTSPLTGGTSTSGLFAGLPGSLQAVALQGNAAPAGGGTYGSLTNASPVLNAAGQLAFLANLNGGSAPSGLFVGAPGSLQAVALTGSAAPSGGNYNGILTPLLFTDAGRVAFRSDLTGGTPSPGRGIFTGTPGSVQTVALVGGAAPSGGNYATLPQNPVINASGTVAFNATLTGGSASGGIFTGAPGSLQTVALQGNAAPAGGNYTTFVNPVINSTGRVAFAANLTGGSSNSGIFTGTPGSLQAVALQGTAAPRGGNYGTFFNSPAINASGQLAFTVGLNASTNTSLFYGTAGSVQAIALEGDVSPAGPGVLFSSVGFPALNSAGTLAFTAILTGSGVSTANDAALFGYRGGILSLILREGDVLDLDTGAGVDNRLVSSFSFVTGAGGSDGRPDALNALNVLVYRVSFTDGSTAILTSVVPEPSSLALCTLAGLGLLGYRVRRRKG